MNYRPDIDGLRTESSIEHFAIGGALIECVGDGLGLFVNLLLHVVTEVTPFGGVSR